MLRAHERCRLPQSVKHYSTGCGGSLHTSGMKTHLSLKSLKTPTVLPSKDELIGTPGQGGHLLRRSGAATAVCPACTCIQVSMPREGRRDVACASHPGGAICTSAGSGAAAAAPPTPGTSEHLLRGPRLQSDRGAEPLSDGLLPDTIIPASDLWRLSSRGLTRKKEE